MAVLMRNSIRADNRATVGYEPQLWQMVDALRGSMEAAVYKHLVRCLIFLPHISDGFEGQHSRLEAESSKGADPTHSDKYRAESLVRPEARWPQVKAHARQLTISQLVDDAMAGIERDGPGAQGCCQGLRPPALDKILLTLGRYVGAEAQEDDGDPSRRR